MAINLATCNGLMAHEAARTITIELWTPVIWSALRQIEIRCDATLRRELVEYQFSVLVNQALWAVTEIRRNARWKYLAQRYISKEVKEHWEATETMSRGELVLGLRHEHVLERRYLMIKIRTAQSENEVRDLLSNAVACVVSKSEDRRLGKVDSRYQGWTRYIQAQPPVPVWDRLCNRWLEQ